MFAMMKATLLDLKRNVRRHWNILAFQLLQAIGQDQKEVFPLDAASEMVEIIDLTLKVQPQELGEEEMILFRFARKVSILYLSKVECKFMIC